MKKRIKEKDLICSECAYVYPLKNNVFYLKLKGFKYMYCFKCDKITRHQLIEPVDIYKRALEAKDYEEYTGKDKVLKRAFSKKL